MSDVHSRRFILPLSILLLILAGTCSYQRTIVPANDCAATGHGVQHRQRPVVCISESGGKLVADPESIEVWDRYPKGSSNPMMVHWVSRSSAGALSIDMKDAGCVEPPDCRGKGHCSAKTLSATAPTKQCKYTVTLDGIVLDPDVILVRCCMASDEEPGASLVQPRTQARAVPARR